MDRLGLAVEEVDGAVVAFGAVVLAAATDGDGVAVGTVVLVGCCRRWWLSLIITVARTTRQTSS